MVTPLGTVSHHAAQKSDRVLVGTYHRLQNALEQSVEPSVSAHYCARRRDRQRALSSGVTIGSAATTWIYRVALNTALSWSRKERKHGQGRQDIQAGPIIWIGR